MERRDPDSIFHYYKKLLQLRKQHLVAVYGTYELVDSDPDLWVYTRTLEDEQLVVVTNPSAKQMNFELPTNDFAHKRLLIANYVVEDATNSLCLRPYEARVYLLRKFGVVYDSDVSTDESDVSKVEFSR